MLKRGSDIIFALAAIVILSPVYVLLAVLIKLETPGPVLFVQERAGKGSAAFKIYKFRSMFHQHRFTPEELGPVKHDHAVVTRVGHFMRRTKLDEIPQFFNVLLGTMSIVGPRPCLLSSVATMSAFEQRRFQVLPGITGWAEVNGNVELSWPEQLLLDVWYVDHRSGYLDLLIMCKTLQTVMLGSIRNPRALMQAECYYEQFKKLGTL